MRVRVCVCYKPSTRVWFFWTIADLQKRRLCLCATCNMIMIMCNVQFIKEVDTINVNRFASASAEAAEAHTHGTMSPASVQPLTRHQKLRYGLLLFFYFFISNPSPYSGLARFEARGCAGAVVAPPRPHLLAQKTRKKIKKFSLMPLWGQLEQLGLELGMLCLA